MPVAASYATPTLPSERLSGGAPGDKKSVEMRSLDALFWLDAAGEKVTVTPFASVRMQEVHSRRETSLSFSKTLTF